MLGQIGSDKMSVKPIDYINTISKSQDVSKIKHIENEKTNIYFDQGIAQQKKNIEANLKKVLKSNKSEYRVVDKHPEDKKNKNGNSEKKSNKKKKASRYNKAIGREIDIKI